MTLFLVTGGAGFIGSNIVEELLKRGDEVRVLDNFSTGRRENIHHFLDHDKFKLIEGDLRNPETVDKAVKGVEYVLHQGALPSVPRSIADPKTTNDVNINGTLNVLEAARKYDIKRLVFASSSSIYGNTELLPKTEDMPVNPLSPYALTKYAGEKYCQLYHQLYGLETVALRYFNVFGLRQDPTSQYSAVIPKFIKFIKEGKHPVIYGDGQQSRDFTFVSNNIQANILACTTPDVGGEVFNIACGERFTLMDLMSNLNRLLGATVEPVFESPRIGDVKHSLASIDRAVDKLNFKVNRSFIEGLSIVAHEQS